MKSGPASDGGSGTEVCTKVVPGDSGDSTVLPAARRNPSISVLRSKARSRRRAHSGLSAGVYWPTSRYSKITRSALQVAMVGSKLQPGLAVQAAAQAALSFCRTGSEQTLKQPGLGRCSVKVSRAAFRRAATAAAFWAPMHSESVVHRSTTFTKPS